LFVVEQSKQKIILKDYLYKELNRDYLSVT